MWGLPALVGLVVAGCVQSDSLVCAPDLLCPLDQQCDLAHHGCADPDQLTTCADLPDGAPCMAAAVADGTCDQGVCLAVRCGDGYRQGLEECDGTDLGAKTCDDFGFYDDAPLGCNDDCTYRSTGVCTGFCGDGETRVGKELCDGAAPQLSCTDLGYGAGFLDCTSQCGPALDDCTLFGWAQHFMTSPTADVHGTTDDNVFAVSATAPEVFFFDGQVWTAFDVSACNFAPTDHFFKVFTVGPRDAFAISEQGFVAHFSPTLCTKTALGMTPYDIWAASPSDVHVVDLEDIYHYDGTTWTLASSQGGAAIWGSAANDVWASEGGMLMHYNGSTWSPADTLPGAFNITALWGTGPNDVYAAGFNTFTGKAYVYRYGGAGWTTILDTAAPVPIRSGTVAHGHPIIGFGVGKVQAYDGTRWTTLLPIGSYTNINGLWTTSSTQRVYATTMSAPAVLAFGGSTRIDHAPKGLAADRIAIKSETEVYVVFRYDSGSGALYRFNGTSWFDETVDTSVRDVWVDSNGGVRVIEGAGTMKLRTGTNVWSSLGTPPGTRLWGASTNDYWVLHSGGAMAQRYVNGVATPTNCLDCTAHVFNDVWGTTASNVFFVGTGGDIMRFDGTNLMTMNSGTTVDLLTVRGSPDGAHVWASGVDGTLLYLVGSTWQKVPFPYDFTPIYSVWGTGPNDIVVGIQGFMFHYDGMHWSPVAANATGNINEIESLGRDLIMYVEAGQPGSLHSILRLAPW